MAPPRMRVHRLEIYPCSGDVWCVGCFVEHPPEDEPDEPASAAAAPATSPRPEPAGAAPLPPMPPLHPRALIEAQWRSGERVVGACLPDERLEARVRVLGFPAAQPVTFSISDGAELCAESSTDSAAVAWKPPRPGTYRFVATCGDRTAWSPALEVLSWTRVVLVDDHGRPLDCVEWRLTDGSGAERSGRTGAGGVIAWRGCEPGHLMLQVGALPPAREDDEPGPWRATATVLAGDPTPIDDASEHVLRVDRGLVLCVRLPASVLDVLFEGADVVLTGASGDELERKSLAHARVPQGDHVALAFNHVQSDAAVAAHLEWPDGARAPLFALQAPVDVDGRQAGRPAGQLLDGAVPEGEIE